MENSVPLWVTGDHGARGQNRLRSGAGVPGTGAVSVSCCERSSLADDGEDVAGAQDQVVLAVVLDLGAAVLGVDDLVTDIDVQRDAVAVVVDAAGAGRDDLALLRLLLGGVRDHQAGLRGLLGFERRYEDTVLERLDRDRHLLTSTVEFLVFSGCCRRPSASAVAGIRGRAAGTLEWRVPTPNL